MIGNRSGTQRLELPPMPSWEVLAEPEEDELSSSDDETENDQVALSPDNANSVNTSTFQPPASAHKAIASPTSIFRANGPATENSGFRQLSATSMPRPRPDSSAAPFSHASIARKTSGRQRPKVPSAKTTLASTSTFAPPNTGSRASTPTQASSSVSLSSQPRPRDTAVDSEPDSSRPRAEKSASDTNVKGKSKDTQTTIKEISDSDAGAAPNKSDSIFSNMPVQRKQIKQQARRATAFRKPPFSLSQPNFRRSRMDEEEEESEPDFPATISQMGRKSSNNLEVVTSDTASARSPTSLGGAVNKSFSGKLKAVSGPSSKLPSGLSSSRPLERAKNREEQLRTSDILQLQRKTKCTNSGLPSTHSSSSSARYVHSSTQPDIVDLTAGPEHAAKVLRPATQSNPAMNDVIQLSSSDEDKALKSKPVPRSVPRPVRTFLSQMQRPGVARNPMVLDDSSDGSPPAVRPAPRKSAIPKDKMARRKTLPANLNPLAFSRQSGSASQGDVIVLSDSDDDEAGTRKQAKHKDTTFSTSTSVPSVTNSKSAKYPQRPSSPPTVAVSAPAPASFASTSQGCQASAHAQETVVPDVFSVTTDIVLDDFGSGPCRDPIANIGNEIGDNRIPGDSSAHAKPTSAPAAPPTSSDVEMLEMQSDRAVTEAQPQLQPTCNDQANEQSFPSSIRVMEALRIPPASTRMEEASDDANEVDLMLGIASPPPLKSSSGGTVDTQGTPQRGPQAAEADSETPGRQSQTLTQQLEQLNLSYVAGARGPESLEDSNVQKQHSLQAATPARPSTSIPPGTVSTRQASTTETPTQLPQPVPPIMSMPKSMRKVSPGAASMPPPEHNMFGFYSSKTRSPLRTPSADGTRPVVDLNAAPKQVSPMPAALNMTVDTVRNKADSNTRTVSPSNPSVSLLQLPRNNASTSANKQPLLSACQKVSGDAPSPQSLNSADTEFSSPSGVQKQVSSNAPKSRPQRDASLSPASTAKLMIPDPPPPRTVGQSLMDVINSKAAEVRASSPSFLPCLASDLKLGSVPKILTTDASGIEPGLMATPDTFKDSDDMAEAKVSARKLKSLLPGLSMDSGPGTSPTKTNQVKAKAYPAAGGLMSVSLPSPLSQLGLATPKPRSKGDLGVIKSLLARVKQPNNATVTAIQKQVVASAAVDENHPSFPQDANLLPEKTEGTVVVENRPVPSTQSSSTALPGAEVVQDLPQARATGATVSSTLSVQVSRRAGTTISIQADKPSSIHEQEQGRKRSRSSSLNPPKDGDSQNQSEVRSVWKRPRTEDPILVDLEDSVIQDLHLPRQTRRSSASSRRSQSRSSTSTVDSIDMLDRRTDDEQDPLLEQPRSPASDLTVAVDEITIIPKPTSESPADIERYFVERDYGMVYKRAEDIPKELVNEVNDIPEWSRNPDVLRQVFESAIMTNTTQDEPEAPYIRVINDIDDEPTPPFEFYYTNYLWHGVGVPPPDYQNLRGCDCIGKCDPRSKTCTCLRRQRTAFAEREFSLDGFIYDEKGRLKEHQFPIFECNDACGCTDDCGNRVVQLGRKCIVNIVKTAKKGWGVFAGKRIPKNTFIGIYSGELIVEEEAERRGKVYNDFGRTYLFDVDFWHIKKHEDEQAKYCVDAFHAGNFTRFLNHSCDPNCRINACHINDANVEKALLAIFSSKDIDSGQELCFSYHGDQGDDDDDDMKAVVGSPRNKASKSNAREKVYARCECGARNCNGKLFIYDDGSDQ